MRGELGYESDHPYQVLASSIGITGRSRSRYVSMESELADAMESNPRLRVLVLAAIAISPSRGFGALQRLASSRCRALRANISIERYESGHMMYLFKRPDAEKLRRDLVGFIDGKSHRSFGASFALVILSGASLRAQSKDPADATS